MYQINIDWSMLHRTYCCADVVMCGVGVIEISWFGPSQNAFANEVVRDRSHWWVRDGSHTCCDVWAWWILSGWKCVKKCSSLKRDLIPRTIALMEELLWFPGSVPPKIWFNVFIESRRPSSFLVCIMLRSRFNRFCNSAGAAVTAALISSPIRWTCVENPVPLGFHEHDFEMKPPHPIHIANVSCCLKHSCRKLVDSFSCQLQC